MSVVGFKRRQSAHEEKTERTTPFQSKAFYQSLSTSVHSLLHRTYYNELQR